MRKFLDALYLAAGGVAALCVCAICALMIGQSVLREFGIKTGAVNDVVAWLCAAAAFLAMAHAFKHGDFVRVTLLLEKLAPKSRQQLELVSLSCALVAVGYLFWSAALFTYESWVFKDVAGGLLPMPMWIPQMSFLIGAGLFFIAVADEFVIVARGKRPTYVVAVEERHAQGDFSSDV
jgi:TRAP-type C4-dicarboxylate transport system permease small subunit